MRKILVASAVAAMVAASGSANAATVGTSFGVSASVNGVCLVSALPLAFGAYTPAAGAIAANTTVSVRCTRNTGFSVALNGGSTTGGTISQRLLTNGTDTLQYNLFTTAAFGTIFGDSTTGSPVAGTGNGVGVAQAVAVTVYGQLPDSAANQSVPAGAYTDTVGVTVTY
jgi:spore coat protein U-like protein